VIGDSGAGVLSDDLCEPCVAALEIPRQWARAHSVRFTWNDSPQQFLGIIEASRAERALAAAI